MRSDRTEKLRPTAFDIVAAALAPALIIGMIASLVFFLVIAFYRGQYDLRLMYILGLFTLATVLIARIAIESGRTHANAFAVPLALVAAIAMFRFVTVPGGLEILGSILNIGLLALVWFLADRITFDCTLVEEDRESVQGGLLQTLGIPEGAGSPAEPTPKSAPTVVVRKRAKHNPGVWVLYFALLAFPLFGLGQLAIPDAVERSRAFWLLVAYLGCALGLLTTTSLLALRRYLRQRGVEMPVEITARWLMAGTGIALAVLIACMLLPLPGRNLGLIALPFEITSPDNLPPSRFGIGNDGQQNEAFGAPQADDPQSDQENAIQAQQGQPSAEGPSGDEAQGTREGKSGQQGQQGEQGQKGEPAKGSQRNQQDRQGQAGAKPNEPSDASENSQAQDQRDPSRDRPGQQPEADRDSDQPAASPKQQQEPQPSSSSQAPASRSPSFNVAEHLPTFSGSLGQWFKWLTIALLIAIVVLYVVTHPGEMVKLWRGLLEFLAMLFGGRRVREDAESASTAAASAGQARPRFAAFANPFAQNLRGWEGARVVEHTFAALEAWAAEHGHARLADQTAEEFARRLAARVPQLGKLPIMAAGMLDRVMFAGWRPANSDLAPLGELWQRLESLQFLTVDAAL